MSTLSIDTLKTLDAAVEANRAARRDKLVRAVRDQRIRGRIALALSGCVALFALIAFFVAHDLEAALLIDLMACLTLAFSVVAGAVGRKKAARTLQQSEESAI